MCFLLFDFQYECRIGTFFSEDQLSFYENKMELSSLNENVTPMLEFL